MDTELLLRALDETWGAACAIARELPPDDAAWHAPTPCPEWDVHDVVAHLAHIEGVFRGMPQPDGPPPAGEGLDSITGQGVAARAAWSPAQVVDELERVADATLAYFHGLDGDGWSGNTFGPLGPTTVEGLAAIRTFDVFVHVLDLRRALGRPLDADATPAALAVAVARPLTSAPWGAVKRAKLADGTRLRIELTGAAAQTVDVVVEGGRGRREDPAGTADGMVRAPAAAFLLLAAGRRALIDEAGGIDTDGDAAEQFVAAFDLFA